MGVFGVPSLAAGAVRLIFRVLVHLATEAVLDLGIVTGL